MRVMEDHLEIKFEEGKKGQPKKLLLVNKKSQIIYTRDLTEKEWKDHCIKEYFDEFLSLEIADMNGRYQLMIDFIIYYATCSIATRSSCRWSN